MPAQFIIRGGKPLTGALRIQGSKNSALPLIAACLVTEKPCTFLNVPEISDVAVMTEISKALGANLEWDKSAKRLKIEASILTDSFLDEKLARKLRASILFSGALLGRLRQVRLPYPGGDAIGSRPIKTHLAALAELGVKINEKKDEIQLDGSNLHGADLILEEPSVTATENTILASVLAPGRTIIRMAANEPHVQELVNFLSRIKAKIRWQSASTIEIEGVDSGHLDGAKQAINPDELEISGFAALAAATRSTLTLTEIEPHYLDAVFLQLRKMGVTYEVDAGNLNISKPASGYRAFRLQSGLYPKLGSDHLPPFAVLATQAEGASLVHDWLYEGRLRYLSELEKLGARATILDPHRALIHGPTPLWGAELSGLDIRSGMTLVIAGLVAQGETIISDIQHLDRGYERLNERLQAIGADIQRVEI